LLAVWDECGAAGTAPHASEITRSDVDFKPALYHDLNPKLKLKRFVSRGSNQPQRRIRSGEGRLCWVEVQDSFEPIMVTSTFAFSHNE